MLLSRWNVYFSVPEVLILKINFEMQIWKRNRIFLLISLTSKHMWFQMLSRWGWTHTCEKLNVEMETLKHKTLTGKTACSRDSLSCIKSHGEIYLVTQDAGTQFLFYNGGRSSLRMSFGFPGKIITHFPFQSTENINWILSWYSHRNTFLLFWT